MSGNLPGGGSYGSNLEKRRRYSEENEDNSGGKNGGSSGGGFDKSSLCFWIIFGGAVLGTVTKIPAIILGGFILAIIVAFSKG